MNITITAEDIAHGKACSSSFCPIAAALNRHAPLRSGYRWCVGLTHASIVTANGALAQSERYPLPIHVQIWREAYDKGQTTAPIEFEFEYNPPFQFTFTEPAAAPARVAYNIVAQVMHDAQARHGDAWMDRTPEYYEQRARTHLELLVAERKGYSKPTGENHIDHALSDCAIARTLRDRQNNEP